MCRGTAVETCVKTRGPNFCPISCQFYLSRKASSLTFFHLPGAIEAVVASRGDRRWKTTGPFTFKTAPMPTWSHKISLAAHPIFISGPEQVAGP